MLVTQRPAVDRRQRLGQPAPVEPLDGDDVRRQEFGLGRRRVDVPVPGADLSTSGCRAAEPRNFGVERLGRDSQADLGPQLGPEPLPGALLGVA